MQEQKQVSALDWTHDEIGRRFHVFCDFTYRSKYVMYLPDLVPIKLQLSFLFKLSLCLYVRNIRNPEKTLSHAI